MVILLQQKKHVLSPETKLGELHQIVSQLVKLKYNGVGILVHPSTS
jgi:hypothetical protein